MRSTGLLLAAAAYAFALVACSGDSVGDCFEAGATAYPVHAPGDNDATFKWPGAYHPVRYYAEPGGEMPANVDAALQLWANAFRCSELSFQRVTDSTIADVLVLNPPTMPPLPVAGTTVFADSVGGCRGRTDILLDAQGRLERPVHAWVTPFSTDTTAVNACYHFVSAHEIGHTLGLFSHSANPDDLMYTTPRKRELSLNDRYTVQLLYHIDVTIQPEPR